MLTRIQLDNYRCFINFDLRLKRSTLLLGPNGVGKSVLFDVLGTLRRFVLGDVTATEAFPSQSLTRWLTSDTQTIELTVEGGPQGDPQVYDYRLELEHEPERQRCRVKLELVRTKSQLLFRFAGGDVQLFRDNTSEGPLFPFDWNRSGLTTIMERNDNRRLTWFKRWIRNLVCTQLNPFSISTRSDQEVTHPSTDLSDFASWYRHLVQEHPSNVHELFEALRGVLDRFESLDLRQAGETARIMRTTFFRPDGIKTYPLGFDELSDGQRVLIIYHTMLHMLRDSTATLCLDEPDNFLALHEIQPLFYAFCDRASENGPQLLVTSHHPEAADHTAFQEKMVLTRADGGPTKATSAGEIDANGLTLSEYIARGWHNA